jgi:hypothetical protein
MSCCAALRDSVTPPKRLAPFSSGQQRPDTGEYGQAFASGTVRCIAPRPERLAFVDIGQDELDADYGDSVVTYRTFPGRIR